MRLLTLAVVTSAAFLASRADAQFGRSGDPDKVWKFFSERHDKNADGKITLEEYARGKERFASLDRDGDKLLTRADFEGGRRRGRRRRGGATPSMLGELVIRADKDGDKVVSAGEWKGFVAKIERVDLTALLGESAGESTLVALRKALDSNADGVLARDEVAAAHQRLDINRDGKVTALERTRRAAPRRGEWAPDFTLRFVGKVKAAEKGQTRFRLSQLRGKRPVALIFGSYT